MDNPIRVQLSRAKGWRLPPNTVSVAREAGYTTVTNGVVVDCFARWLRGDRSAWMGKESDEAAALIMKHLPELRGKNLACWCPLDQPCHADILLEIANA